MKKRYKLILQSNQQLKMDIKEHLKDNHFGVYRYINYQKSHSDLNFFFTIFNDF